MEERYPIGETGSVSLAVLRHERREGGYPMWSAALATGGGALASAMILVTSNGTDILCRWSDADAPKASA